MKRLFYFLRAVPHGATPLPAPLRMLPVFLSFLLSSCDPAFFDDGYYGHGSATYSGAYSSGYPYGTSDIHLASYYNPHHSHYSHYPTYHSGKHHNKHHSKHYQGQHKNEHKNNYQTRPRRDQVNVGQTRKRPSIQPKRKPQQYVSLSQRNGATSRVSPPHSSQRGGKQNSANRHSRTSPALQRPASATKSKPASQARRSTSRPTSRFSSSRPSSRPSSKRSGTKQSASRGLGRKIQ